MANDRWYPNNVTDPAVNQAFRQAFDRLYAVQDRLPATSAPTMQGMPSGSAPSMNPASSLTPVMMVQEPANTTMPGVLNALYASPTAWWAYTPQGWRSIAWTGGGGGGGFTLNGTAGSVSIAAGANITIGNGGSTITIQGPTVPAATNFSLNGSSSSVSLVAGVGIGISSNLSTMTVSVSTNATNFSLNGSSSSVSLVAGANITLNSGASSITIVGPTVPAVTNFSLNGSSSSVSLVAGAGIGISSNLSTLTISVSSAAPVYTLSYLEDFNQQFMAPVLTSSSNAASSLALGSSFFLNRLILPAPMKLSEFDIALGLAYAATNSGAGSLSQSYVVYSFGNSTSLASVLSVGGSTTWTSGTSTAGTSSSITQFQQAWSGQFIRPLTFASSLLAAGEYVVGMLLNASFAAASWSFTLYGGNAATMTSATLAAATGLASTAANFVTSTSAIGSVVAISNAGTAQVAVMSNAGTAGTDFAIGTLTTSSFSATSQISSIAARTVFTAAPTVASRTVFSAAPTAASAISSFALATAAAVTNVALAAAGSTTISHASTAIPNLSYQYQGTSSAIPASVYPTAFDAGILSTGATVASIALTAAAMITTGSAALIQPWLALAGN